MDDKLKQIQKLLDAAEGNLHSARNLMREMTGTGSAPAVNAEEKAKKFSIIEEGKVIEGVYNGESMVGPDGKEYPVPANYASKSKLVEGDVLKLTIAEDGSFIFKQIQPIERRNLIGTLSYAGGNWGVNAEGKTYKVLQASVTYYKGEPGDQVTIIVPKDHESTWAAVENIIKGSSDSDPKPEEESEVKTDTVETTETEPKAKDEVGETPDENAVNTQEVQESIGEEDTGPMIEMPPIEVDDPKPESIVPELDDKDKEILDNLSNTTSAADPEPEKVEEPTPTPPETPQADEGQGSSEGIKELDI